MSESASATNALSKADEELRALEALLDNGDDDLGQELHSKQDDEELKALGKLLEEEETTKDRPPAPAVPRLREDSTFAEAFSYELDELLASKAAEFNTKLDDCDSSDEEDLKNFLERKYNEYGCGVNKRLKQQREVEKEAKISKEVNAALKASIREENQVETLNSSSSDYNIHIKNPHTTLQRQSHANSSSFRAKPNQAPTPQAAVTSQPPMAVFMDPVFGLRMVNPLISSSLLKERMNGRKPVAFAAVGYHTQHGDLSQDWVIAGVIVNKAPVKMTKKGDPYSSWRLSDLKGDIKMITLLLFRGAHKDLWKTAEGMCIAVLNPTVLEKRGDGSEVACLSIDTAQKVMVLGQSKDLGKCKAKKRNGEACTSVVNLNDCDYCVFHMKQEYAKLSRRSEFNSSGPSRGLNDLRNKVLGKSEVFYGGQSYTAIPARKSAKQAAKDSKLMSALSEYAVSPFASSVNHQSKPKTPMAAVPYATSSAPVSRLAGNVEASGRQRLKDLERLKVLQDEAQKSNNNNKTDSPSSSKKHSPTSVDTTPTSTASTSFSSPRGILASVPDKYKDRVLSFTPKLSQENFSLEVNIGERKSQLAKLKAMQVLKAKPIEKVNPNSTRGTQEGKRRLIDDLNDKFTSTGAKRQKMEEEQREADRKSRIQRIMDAASSHTNLVDMREQQEQDKYFSKLEKKEALEEKMLQTYKVPCKAVICQRCKYTAFSAAERCKEERHPLKVVDAEKRFFECKDCGNRTATVFKLPKTSCKTCQGSNWQRTAMIREKKLCDNAHMLSVRGDEETFLGSIQGSANLNLLVPEE